MSKSIKRQNPASPPTISAMVSAIMLQISLGAMHVGFIASGHHVLAKIVSEYDQEIPELQVASKPYI